MLFKLKYVVLSLLYLPASLAWNHDPPVEARIPNNGVSKHPKCLEDAEYAAMYLVQTTAYSTLIHVPSTKQGRRAALL
jgi:hypothetical protein